MIDFDPNLLRSFRIFDVFDPDEMGKESRFSRKSSAENNFNIYQLRRRQRLDDGGAEPIWRFAKRCDGDLTMSYIADRFSTSVGIVGDGAPRYCLTLPLSGGMEMIAGPNGAAMAHGTKGFVYRGLPDTRFSTTDKSVRLTLWIEEARLQRTLQARLDKEVRQPLRFTPGIDWQCPSAAPLVRALAFFFNELADPWGLASVPMALESFTDVLANLMLARLDHNYSAGLVTPGPTPTPWHLRRAEAFIEAHADRAMAMGEVAAAAGCSVRTLQEAFRRFRETTPLAEVQRARLRAVRAGLQATTGDEPAHVIARRFGFTNPARFRAAYVALFGEEPHRQHRPQGGSAH